MLRSEAGNGEIERKASKASGSDNAALDAGKPESGNSLTKEFTDTIMSQMTPSSGSDADRAAALEASGSSRGEKAKTADERIVAAPEGEARRSSTAAGERANGSEKKSTDSLTGSGKAPISDAFPSSTQLLNQLKV